jgi:hypothetical protein
MLMSRVAKFWRFKFTTKTLPAARRYRRRQRSVLQEMT